MKTRIQTIRRAPRITTVAQRIPTVEDMNPINLDSKHMVIVDFETVIEGFSHRHCKNCHACYLESFEERSKKCKICGNYPEKWTLSNNALPVWYLNDVAQFHIPVELEGLDFGEKLLIQQATPYVPLFHIKNGTMGIKGHVCCFPSAIDRVCKVLPRLPQDLKILKVIHSYSSSKNGECRHLFRIRRDRVLDALMWLKTYND